MNIGVRQQKKVKWYTSHDYKKKLNWKTKIIDIDL